MAINHENWSQTNSLQDWLRDFVIQEKYLCDIILYLLNLGALEIEIPISITVKLGNKELFGHRTIVH